MEYAALAVTLLGILFGAANAWGVITTRVEDNKKETERMCAEIKKELGNIEDKIKQCVGREHCSLKHEFLGKTLEAIEKQLAEIRNILKEMNENRG